MRVSGLVCVALAVAATPGWAGSDCLGGAIRAGVCQPFSLTVGQQRPFGLAVDGMSVYWTGTVAYQVNRTSVNGGPVETLAEGAEALGPAGVAVRAGFVFWAAEGGGTVWRSAPGSFAPEPVAIATGQAGPHSLATDR